MTTLDRPTRRARARAMQPVLITGDKTDGSINDHLIEIPLRPPGWRWLALVGFGLSGMMVMTTAITALLWYGVGVWGINVPVAWGFAITNFVWWIGIGHAGTFISAILLLLRQDWRNSINRFAEAMTLFAVANAGLFPLLHLGRIQKFYYLLPLPNNLGAWPQWRSPLVWDVVAVSTYGLVSLMFWYIGLLPDLASLRDGARRQWVKVLAGLAALGWRGESRQWQRHQSLYLVLAGLATPLVISVHSIVALDFAVAIVPGWHSTIFPPYFVAGAIFSGFAMVVTICTPLRKIFKLQDIITLRHFNNMGKIILLTGLIVSYGYLMEIFTAFFSGDRFEIDMTLHRMTGPYWPVYWGTILCNVVAPQLLWFRFFRSRIVPLFLVCQFVNVGMWLERYMIVVTSLAKDFTPSAWHIFHGTIWDWALLGGTLTFFLTLMLIFVKFVPMVPAYEIKELLHRFRHGRPAPGDSAGAAVGTGAAGPTSPTRTTGAEEEGGPSSARAGGGGADSSGLSASVDGELAFDQTPPDDSMESGYIPPLLPLQPGEVYALVAEFRTSGQLLTAARKTRQAGYDRVNAYTPMPLEELAEAMKLPRSYLPLWVLIGAVCGAVTAFGFQYWAAVIDYPWNIGGRPDYSWPAFIPITFEFTILCGALCGVAGLLITNRFPEPYHAVSNTPGFERASRDRYFLAIEAGDQRYDRQQTRRLLNSFAPLRVSEVGK